MRIDVIKKKTEKLKKNIKNIIKHPNGKNNLSLYFIINYN